MTPEQFIAKWRQSSLNERAAAHSHFNDLCKLLDVENPVEADPTGREYRFEKPVRKLTGGKGFVDVWKNRCFGWEYKGPRKNLVEAYAQLKHYTDDLRNPPLLIVSDMQEIRIHTNFTNRIAQQKVIPLPDLVSREARDTLRWCFTAPERLEPTATRESVTAEAAARFGKIGALLRQQYPNHERRVAHFLTKLVFCLFVQDIDLLPDRIFAGTIDEAVKRPEDLTGMLSELFRAMANPHSRFGKTAIPWFNGGLFDDHDVLPLTITAIRDLQTAARLDWSAIDPSIFGVLFESGLDEKKRAEMASLFDLPPLFEGLLKSPDQQRAFPSHRAVPDKGVGIHYTDAGTIMKIIETIMKIIEPVMLRPLRAEWEAIKTKIVALFARKDKAKSGSEKTRLVNKARDLYAGFRSGLGKFRVLDPACGSGNFLALALSHLKDFDLAVMREAESIGLPIDRQRIGSEAVLGIEINPYAVELARLTVWITELQWQLRNNFELKQRHPILGRLDGIVCRDALIDRDGSEADWPAANIVIGNPPFLGNKKMSSHLGDSYVSRLRNCFEGRLSGSVNLVCYWFEKARALVALGRVERVGLVTTKTMASGASRHAIDRICNTGHIFEAWSDQLWVINGAAVRVALICFSKTSLNNRINLDGAHVSEIFSDLRAAPFGKEYMFDLTKAQALIENSHISFQGVTKGGPFEIQGELARKWLKLPSNPNGRSNLEVVKPMLSGGELARHAKDRWVIDFAHLSSEQAALFEAPFAYVERTVRPKRLQNKRPLYQQNWWKFAEPRPGMFRAIQPLNRFIVTAKVSRHRFFVWRTHGIVPDNLTIVIARDDDTSFGVLESRFHRSWSLRKAMDIGVGDDPTYTPTTTFETFPFPEGLTLNVRGTDYAKDPRAIAIAAAAQKLDRLRNTWLNPPNLVRIVPEVVPGFPDRILPADTAAEKELKKRTLTNLYNERPTWLTNAHRDLDAAVAAAYGWVADISEEDALARLLELNNTRAARQESLIKARQHAKKRPTQDQLRREPPLPPMSLPGGKDVKRGQPHLDLNEPLLTPTSDRVPRKRSRVR